MIFGEREKRKMLLCEGISARTEKLGNYADFLHVIKG